MDPVIPLAEPTIESDAGTGKLWSIALVLFQLAAAALFVVMMGRMYFSITRSSRLTHESGIWIALAMDFSHGVLYRPLMGPLGYGGTRYFPLQIILHGTLIRLGLSPIHAGFAILIAAAAILVFSLFRLMRRLGIPTRLAWPLCVLALGTAAAEMALTMIRGDLLPAALNVTALAMCAGIVNPAAGTVVAKSNRPTILAGIIFGLAFLTKITTVFGLFAAVAVFWFSRSRLRKQAIILAGIFALVAAGGLLCTQLISHGSWYVNLRATGAGGEQKSLIKHLAMMVPQVAVEHDPIGFALVALGIAAAGLASWRSFLQLPYALLLTTGAVTLVLFLTPGIDKNHFIDIQIVCLLLLGLQCTGGVMQRSMLLPALVFLTIAAASVGWYGLMGDLPYRGRQNAELANSIAPNEPGPMLSDFALLPVMRNQSPYFLDDFMFPVVCAKHPEILRDLYQKLDQGFFSSVVLKADPTRDFRKFVWGADFPQHLQNQYKLTGTHGVFLIYQRKNPKM